MQKLINFMSDLSRMIKFALAFLSVSLFAVLAFAQEIVEPGAGEISTWVGKVLTLIASGGSSLAIGLVVVQGAMLALRSKLGEKAGKWRYLAVAFFSFVAAAVAILVTGQDWSQVFHDAGVLAAFNVFMHQAFVQFFTAEGNEVEKS